MVNTSSFKRVLTGDTLKELNDLKPYENSRILENTYTYERRLMYWWFYLEIESKDLHYHPYLWMKWHKTLTTHFSDVSRESPIICLRGETFIDWLTRINFDPIDDPKFVKEVEKFEQTFELDE